MQKEGGEGKVIQIDIVADVLCPWCYIGHSRLWSALEHFKLNKAIDGDSAYSYNVFWHPFVLDPALPTYPDPSLDKVERARRLLGESRAQETQDNLNNIGREMGIDFSFGWVWDAQSEVPSRSWGKLTSGSRGKIRLSKDAQRLIMKGTLQGGLDLQNKIISSLFKVSWVGISHRFSIRISNNTSI